METLELIKTLPPELREIIYKEFIKIKLRERKALGWDEVNAAIKEAPFCDTPIQQMVTRPKGPRFKNHGGKHQGLARHKPFSRRYSVFLRKKWRRRKQVDNSTIKILVKMPKIESTGIKERPCRKVGFVT